MVPARGVGMTALSQLIDNQPEGFSLRQEFYRDESIYRHELERLFLKSWLYAGHVSQVPETGDYFLYELADESVIVIRSGENSIKALLNLCRHRGSRVCIEAEGRRNLLVCPYHGWTYQLDGTLRGANYTLPDFDRSDYALRQVRLEVLHGMIFINLAVEPASFEPVRRDLDGCLLPYRLNQARVAHRQSYPIRANWKLAVENYCECYHCIPAHPEYSQGHGRSVPDEEVAELEDQVMARAKEVGLTQHRIDKSWLDSGAVGADRGFDRYPLFNGFVTGSRDGKPVAPLLGDIRGYDGGATDIQVGPLTFCLAYCDHVVIYHFRPLNVTDCACDITWLVNGTAQEGKDYKREELTWLWDITTIADKRIIENNQKGVNSTFYRPGPYTGMESFTRGFIDWYLDTMK